MHLRFLLLLLVFLVACTSNSNQSQNEASHTDTVVVPLYRDTLRQNGLRLVQVRLGGKLQSVLTLSGDTIVNKADYYHDVTYPDIDEDGYTDIRVAVVSNTPNQCVNYLFDKTSGRYHRIENAELDFEKVKDTDLYFSYNRSGCADLNWESHLTKIESWAAVLVSRILAKGCGEKDDGIYIYKIQDDKEYLVEKVPIDTKLQENKWTFIKSYWEHHHRKFP